MKEYNHSKIEKRWQKEWEKRGVGETNKNTRGKKSYLLVEFPYPSGEGLHVGHVRSYTALDIVARKKRRQGYNVLYPMGWDAFGLPTENYAIKTGIHPKIITKKNTDYFRKQLKSLGLSFDWSREINTSDPKYYKWTQWIFIELFKKGLAYKATIPINWCVKCKIGLANEEVINGKCERCGGDTEKKDKEQWMLAITKYAERLDKDLDTVDFLERIVTQQRNWIGRSTGAEIDFQIEGVDQKVTVFTTRADTLFGATYLVLAPEHPLVDNLANRIKNFQEVSEYRREADRKTEIERTAEEMEKTGVLLKGVVAINPANNQSIPIYVADYVLGNYGHGAIMAVPAHDERDHAFAVKFKIPIVKVIEGGVDLPYTEKGILINSGRFNGLDSKVAVESILKAVDGKKKTIFKLRDWVFSRQRYWGEPIPMINCPTCGWHPVPEKDLPVTLPNVKSFKPNDSGESPLSGLTSWVNVKCPKCKGKAKRETDVMPNWAGSSWYYLRYCDPKNKKAFASPKNLKYWTPVDWYNGGMEHTTLHLLYSRFWHKFLYDQKLVPTKEPYAKRTSHGLILAHGGEKMSKSKGNVINPDDIVRMVGADTLRLYEMFMGPFDQQIAWSTESVSGSRRFIERVWKLQFQVDKKKKNIAPVLETLMHQTIKKVGEDIENLKMNTAVSQLMIYANALEKEESIPLKCYEALLLCFAPFAPHVCEELWRELGHKSSIHKEKWPSFMSSKLVSASVTIVVQVDGKVRGSISLPLDSKEGEVTREARNLPSISKWLLGKTPKKIIFIPNKIINFVLE